MYILILIQIIKWMPPYWENKAFSRPQHTYLAWAGGQNLGWFGVSLVVFKHKLYRLIEWGGGGGGGGGGYDVTL